MLPKESLWKEDRLGAGGSPEDVAQAEISQEARMQRKLIRKNTTQEILKSVFVHISVNITVTIFFVDVGV